jgi:hypothetical protein
MLYSLDRCPEEREEKNGEGRKATHCYSSNLVRFCLIRRGLHMLYMATLLRTFIRY